VTFLPRTTQAGPSRHTRRESLPDSGAEGGSGGFVNYRRKAGAAGAPFTPIGIMSTNGTEAAQSPLNQPLNCNNMVNELAHLMIFGICPE
jgi:hypothetical protein